MIAKVITNDNKEYYSHVFATFNPGWFELVLVFNNDENKFELLNMYNTNPSLERKIFIIDTDISDFIFKKEIKINKTKQLKYCRGYEWIINNKELISNIINNNEIDEIYINKAKEINNNYNQEEWHYVMNEKDINDLYSAAFSFHDSHLIDIKYIPKEKYSDPTTVQVLFTGCWQCDILLEFKRDVTIYFNSDDACSDEIMLAKVLINKGFIYWVNDNIEDVSELQEYHTYFKARSLKWKMIN